jgi:hypothetical protein
MIISSLGAAKSLEESEAHHSLPSGFVAYISRLISKTSTALAFMAWHMKQRETSSLVYLKGRGNIPF